MFFPFFLFSKFYFYDLQYLKTVDLNVRCVVANGRLCRVTTMPLVILDLVRLDMDVVQPINTCRL